MKYLKKIIFVVLLFVIAWFVQSTDWHKVGICLRLIGFKFIWLLLATFLASLCGAIGWQYCLGVHGKKVHFYDLFLIRHIGETIGLVNPTGMVGGEALKAVMLQEKGIDRATVISSVFVSRTITIITQLILFLATVLLLYYHEIWQKATHFSIYFYIGCFIGLVLLWKLARPIGRMMQVNFSKLAYNVFPARWIHKIKNGQELLVASIREQKGTWVWASFYLTLHWVFGGLEFYLILIFLGEDTTTLLQAIYVDMGVVFFKVAATFVPGQIGAEEYGNKVMLEAIGVHAPEIWITASILRRTRQLFWIAFGLITYFIFYHKWRTAPTLD